MTLQVGDGARSKIAHRVSVESKAYSIVIFPKSGFDVEGRSVCWDAFLTATKGVLSEMICRGGVDSF